MAAAESTLAVLDAGAVSRDIAVVLDGTTYRMQHVVDRLGPIARFLRRHLDTAGDGTGTKAANVDYSGGMTPFKILPAAGVVYIIERLIIGVGDAASTVIDNDGYGGGPALSNGIKLGKYNGSSFDDDYTDGLNVKMHFDWDRLGGVSIDGSYGSSPTNVHRVHIWTPSSPIRLVGDNTEELRVELFDDFSILTEHYFVVEGVQETTKV